MHEQAGLLKEKETNLSGDDYREGMCAIISVKMKDAQFEGQTKGKLGNTEVRTIVEGIVQERLSLFLSDLNNSAMATEIVGKALKAAKARAAATKAKKLERQRSKLDGAPLVGKLSAAAAAAMPKKMSFSSSKVTVPAAAPSRAATAVSRRYCRCGANR